MITNGKGFRQKPQKNRKERLGNLEKRIEGLEMASRISQMMTQQLMQSLRHMQEDLGRALGLLNEMQYKTLAIQEACDLDVAELNEIANGKRLKDFNEASDKEDAANGFTVGDKVESTSTVILTSKTTEVDRGIFRSRLKLVDCGVPELIKGLTGQSVGAKVNVKLNGVDHEVELLAIRNPPPVADESTSDDAVSQAVAPANDTPVQADTVTQ
jgi:hypothetical protein